MTRVKSDERPTCNNKTVCYLCLLLAQNFSVTADIRPLPSLAAERINGSTTDLEEHLNDCHRGL